MKAKFCKCKNTYTINKCKKSDCHAPSYWGQGIGSLTGGTISNVDNQSEERSSSNERPAS